MNNEFYGKKVVSASCLANVEKQAFQQGVNEEDLLLRAGFCIAEEAKHILQKKKYTKILLLAGKGNNAADGYVAASLLQKEGYEVVVWQLFPLEKASCLCQKYAKNFQKQGGSSTFIQEKQKIKKIENALIIDGIFGTGFQGNLEGILLHVVNKINSFSCPILSIDIPSGVNGDTGEVGAAAIKATITVTFSLPKTGFYLEEGPNYCGNIIVKDIGLLQKYLDAVDPDFYLIQEEKIATCLPPIKKKRHKYQAGSVIAIAGSEGMTGAACLASLATLRIGAGIVWVFSFAKIQKAPLEVITYTLSQQDKLQEILPKATALLIGPGLGRDKKVQDFLGDIFASINKPCVIDADGLFFLANHPDIDLLPSMVLTPHKKEMLRLLGKETIKSEKVFYDQCQEYVEKKNVILVVKGAPTILFHQGQKAIIIDRGDPALATAGTGDVLTGMIAGLMAQKVKPYHAAIIGAYLHAIAGELVAKEKTSYAAIASDVIELLPRVIKKIINKKD